MIMDMSVCAFLTRQYVKLLRTLALLKLHNKKSAPVLYLLNENVQERKILNHQTTSKQFTASLISFTYK